MAQKMGSRVRQNTAIRLERRDPGAFGVPKHHAAVWPAIQSDRKTIPENAVDECPEGKDFRPSTTSLARLY